MARAADAMSRSGDVMPFDTRRMMPRPTITDVMSRNQNGQPTRRPTLPMSTEIVTEPATSTDNLVRIERNPSSGRHSY